MVSSSPGSAKTREPGEAVRRVREILLKVGADFKIENTYTLELQNALWRCAGQAITDSEPG